MLKTLGKEYADDDLRVSYLKDNFLRKIRKNLTLADVRPSCMHGKEKVKPSGNCFAT